LATLFSEQPYGAYFHGKVVDMFISHFGKEPPNWLPIWAATILLFNAIFNVADMAISTGVGILITKSVPQELELKKIKKTDSDSESVFYLYYGLVHSV
jgi:lipoprotein signal peptidase